MVEVSASLLNLREEDAIKTLYNLETSDINYFHIDVMDGEFVKNNTLDKMHKFMNYAKQISTLPIDVHLMVKNVKKYIDEYLDLSPRIITFHFEAIKDKEEVIDIIKYIKENNCNVGIAIKPNTKLEEIYEFLPYIHLVLIMTVEPGEGGQKLLEDTINKVQDINKYIKENDIDISIEVDGGINIDNSRILKEAGADIMVVGSAILNSNDYKEVVRKIKEERN